MGPKFGVVEPVHGRRTETLCVESPGDTVSDGPTPLRETPEQ